MIATNHEIYGKEYKVALSNFIAYWKLNGNANDSIGSLNGTSTNISYISGGVVTTQADFSAGTPSIVNFGDNDALSFTDGVGNDLPFSISIWFNYGATVPSGTYHNLISKQNSSSVSEWYIQHHLDGTIWVILASMDSSNNINIRNVIPSGGWQPNTKYNLVITYDGSKLFSGIKAYLNNIPITGTSSMSGTYTGMSNTVAPLKLGAINTTNSFQFRGTQCEVALFNKVLSPKEIQWIYNKGLSGKHLI